jgi:hypothetical protein
MSFLKNLRPKRGDPTSRFAHWNETLGSGNTAIEVLETSEAQKIVSAYGQALIFSSRLNDAEAENESLLPYPKALIRSAIRRLLEDDSDPNRTHLLEAGLKLLEEFH